MPKLLDYLLPAYNWLVAIDPSLPRALFVALVFVTVMAWRKLLPASWIKFSSLIPVSDEDTSWFKATLRKAWQALPSALLGAVYGALGTGGNVLASLKLAALALLAPVIHDVAAKYQGTLGTKKNPPPDDPDTTVSLMPDPVRVVAQDRSRLHNDSPDEPAELRKWKHPSWRLDSVFAFGGVALLAFLVVMQPGCSLFSKADWDKLGTCAAVLQQPLLNQVATVLAGAGDVESGLLAIVKSGAAKEAVECAVAQIVNDIGKQPADSNHARIRARGRAFLATVPQ